MSRSGLRGRHQKPRHLLQIAPCVVWYRGRLSFPRSFTRGDAMLRRLLLVTAILACGFLVPVLIHLGISVPVANSQDKQPAGVDVFAASKVWPVHLELAAKEYEAMQPPPGGG